MKLISLDIQKISFDFVYLCKIYQYSLNVLGTSLGHVSPDKPAAFPLFVPYICLWKQSYSGLMYNNTNQDACVA